MQLSASIRTVRRFPDRQSADDVLAVEEPLEIRIDGDPLAVTMRTPGHDEDLAAGFCWTEGVVDHPDQIERVSPCTQAQFGNVVDVILADDVRQSRSRHVDAARRELYMSSSCGLCGTSSIERIRKRVQPFQGKFSIAASMLKELPMKMQAGQHAFALTGGLHAAAWFSEEGELQLLREDVGRHNAVDKLAGAMLLSGQLAERPGVLLVSGRVSFELIQKAARARLPILAAMGAPTTLAVDAAREFGMTLIGFLKPDGRFNIYADSGRVGINDAG